MNLYLKEITDAATEYLNAAADAAKAAIDNADSKLKEAQAALTNANTKLQGWEDSISAYQDKLRKRAEEIEKAKAAFAQDCDRECGKGKESILFAKTCMRMGFYISANSTFASDSILQQGQNI